MGQWKPIVGLALDAPSFDTYCKSMSWPTWRPSFIVLHNTGSPKLADRPNGFTKQHIQNLVVYYRDQQKWTAGPHLFVDDRQIWVFTPLTVTGRHSPSWNMSSIGIEMLGDYDHDDFSAGRGSAVARNAISAMASLSGALGLDPGTMRLHKEDPLTTHDCPGAHVNKADVISRVRAQLEEHYAAEHEPSHPHP